VRNGIAAGRSTRSLDVMSVARWLAFGWGCIAVAVMGYFGYLWASDPSNPYRNEVALGFGIGAVYGAPAWVALPVLVWLGRRKVNAITGTVLIAPVVIAAVLGVAYVALGGT
jgi:hypothetical protein